MLIRIHTAPPKATSTLLNTYWPFAPLEHRCVDANVFFADVASALL